jgi:hypothetical protein
MQSFLEYRDPKRYNRWICALRGAIAGFSDQQLATGFSVLIAGYSQLQIGISSYHWVLVCNLAWFSSITHLITLTSLRSDTTLRKEFKWARIVLMGLLNVFLIVTITPTGHLWTNAKIPNGFPAICLFRRDTDWRDYEDQPIPHDFNLTYILLSVFVLGFGYITRS